MPEDNKIEAFLVNSEAPQVIAAGEAAEAEEVALATKEEFEELSVEDLKKLGLATKVEKDEVL